MTAIPFFWKFLCALGYTWLSVSERISWHMACVIEVWRDYEEE
jgi:hypothetical protein